LRTEIKKNEFPALPNQENVMSEKVKSSQCWWQAAGLSLALLGLAAVPVGAAAQEAQQPAAAASSDAMTVVRDAETGQLRHATAAEAQALQQPAGTRSLRAAAAPPASTLRKTHPNGAQGLRLTDEFISAAVAVRKPDGGIEMQCFESHQSADEAMKAGHTHVTTPETE
jgi:hypothetical protein